MLKELIHKMKNTLNEFRVWLLYQNYSHHARNSLQKEITETLDEVFEENKEVMAIFKKRLIGLYENDKRN